MAVDAVERTGEKVKVAKDLRRGPQSCPETESKGEKETWNKQTTDGWFTLRPIVLAE